MLVNDGCLPKHFRNKKGAKKEYQITFQSDSTKASEKLRQARFTQNRSARAHSFLSLPRQEERVLPMRIISRTSSESWQRNFITSRLLLQLLGDFLVSISAWRGKWMYTLSWCNLKEFNSLRKLATVRSRSIWTMCHENMECGPMDITSSFPGVAFLVLLCCHLELLLSHHRHHKRQWACSIGSHVCPCHNAASTLFDTWCSLLWNVSSSFPSPLFSLPVILTQVYVGFNRPKNLISYFYRCFLAKSNPVLECYQRFPPCCKSSVFTFMNASLDCVSLKLIHLPAPD